VGLTALNPRVNNFALMEEQLLTLKRGRAVRKPVYDHRDGTFGPLEVVEPGEVVIVQGLHPLLVPGIRALFGLRVWLDPRRTSSATGRSSATLPSAATRRSRSAARSSSVARTSRRSLHRSAGWPTWSFGSTG